MPAPDSLTPDDLAALLADPTAAGVIKALPAGLGLDGADRPRLPPDRGRGGHARH